jgi:hypothetical protein
MAGGNLTGIPLPEGEEIPDGYDVVGFIGSEWTEKFFAQCIACRHFLPQDITDSNNCVPPIDLSACPKREEHT